MNKRSLLLNLETCKAKAHWFLGRCELRNKSSHYFIFVISLHHISIQALCMCCASLIADSFQPVNSYTLLIAKDLNLIFLELVMHILGFLMRMERILM